MRTLCDPSWMLRHATLDLTGDFLEEIKFRLSQNPHLSFESAEAQVRKYAAQHASRMVWC